jgi:hypothetical protein
MVDGELDVRQWSDDALRELIKYQCVSSIEDPMMHLKKWRGLVKSLRKEGPGPLGGLLGKINGAKALLVLQERQAAGSAFLQVCGSCPLLDKRTSVVQPKSLADD